MNCKLRRNGDKWIVDWPTTEDYAIGPCSIAWTMWHILYWWNTTLIASKENYIIEKEDVITTLNYHYLSLHNFIKAFR